VEEVEEVKEREGKIMDRIIMFNLAPEFKFMDVMGGEIR
jgi:hypothetical protein